MENYNNPIENDHKPQSNSIFRESCVKLDENFTERKLHQCTQCNVIFSKKSTLINHIRSHTGEKPFQCNLCNKAYTRNSILREHMKIHTEDNPYPCSLCDKKFSKNDLLIKHMNSHKEKTYQCIQCGKDFTNRSNLTRHMRTHTNERPYQCNQCDKAFAQKYNLAQHMNTHSEKNVYQCSQCEKTFSKYFWLKKHILSHNGGKQYQCSECDKNYNCKQNLTFHIRSHTGEKPYICTHCKKAFSKKSYLIRHTRIHTGERPYQCIQCDLAFSQKSLLERHILKHNGTRPYQCNHCEESFSHEINLRYHKKDIHGEIFNGRKNSLIKCNYSKCEEAFYLRMRLIEHIEQEHGINMKIKHLTFESKAKFEAWKEDEESINHVYFTKQQSTIKGTHFYFHCQRDGHSIPHRKIGERQRLGTRRNKKGVIKRDRFCPSRMIGKIGQDGFISVTYIQTHNHDTDISDTVYHPIPKSASERNKALLLMEASVENIENDLSEGISSLERRKELLILRKNGITRKQISEIKHKQK